MDFLAAVVEPVVVKAVLEFLIHCGDDIVAKNDGEANIEGRKTMEE